MPQSPRVALDIETSRIYGRRILDGISRYLRSHQSWSIYLEQQELGNARPDLLTRWRGDGIISRQTTPEFAKQLRQKRIAVVDVSDIYEHLGFCRIGSAHQAIGQLAADHLLERGFRNFGCSGFSDQHWSVQRQTGFVSAVEEAGCHCDIFDSYREEKHLWERDQRHLSHWIATLPRPVGIFATSDARGQQVLDACAHEDIAVPEEVAVIAVDNDELLCGLSNPPLSSVIPNPERIGYEAATLLDRLMSKEASDPDNIEIPPLGIVSRQSSDILAIEDPDVTAALRYIREHACHGITVHDVLDQVPVSRSWLERNFRKRLNRSPQAEIRNVQIKQCKALLATTDLSLERIAGLTGFEHPEYLSVVFKRETGQPPGQYRRLVHE